MLRQLAFASFILLTPSLATAQTEKFQIEEATIEDIQAAILRFGSTWTVSRRTTAPASISRMASSGRRRSHPSRMRISSMP